MTEQENQIKEIYIWGTTYILETNKKWENNWILRQVEKVGLRFPVYFELTPDGYKAYLNWNSMGDRDLSYTEQFLIDLAYSINLGKLIEDKLNGK